MKILKTILIICIAFVLVTGVSAVGMSASVIISDYVLNIPFPYSFVITAAILVLLFSTLLVKNLSKLKFSTEYSGGELLGKDYSISPSPNTDNNVLSQIRTESKQHSSKDVVLNSPVVYERNSAIEIDNFQFTDDDWGTVEILEDEWKRAEIF